MKSRKLARVAGVLVLLLLLPLAFVWWRYRSGEPVPTQVSPEAAALAETKLKRLQAEKEAVQLSEVELASLMRYRAPGWAEGMVRRPSVSFAGDTVQVSGMVPTDRLPDNPELNQVRGLLPDSARVDVTGTLQPLEPGRVALEVSEVTLQGIPIPRRYYPPVLQRLGRRDEPGLSPTALPIRLPQGVREARIQTGHLVLTP
jgi:hypothetical protein